MHNTSLNVTRSKLLKTIFLVLSYLLITIPLAITSSYFALHSFIVLTVGVLMSAFIVDKKQKLFLNIPVFTAIVLLTSYFFNDISYQHIFIIIFHVFISLLSLSLIKKKNSKILINKEVKIYFLVSVLAVNILSSFLAFWIFALSFDELFAWMTSIAMGCIIVTPFIISLYQLKKNDFKKMNFRNSLRHLGLLGLTLFLSIIAIESYIENKYVYYISLVLIVSVIYNCRKHLNDKNIIYLLFVFYSVVMTLMFYYEKPNESILALTSGVEFHITMFFLIAHYFIQQKKDFIKRDDIKQALIDNGYVNMFINLSATKLIVDPQTGDIIDANLAASKFYGYSIEKLKQMNVTDISYYGLQALDKMKEMLAQINNRIETKHRLKNGEIRDVEIFSSDFTINKNTLRHIIIHDITDKKETELELKIAQKRLQSLLSTVSNYTYSVIYDGDDMIYLFHDKECLGVTGYEATELNSDYTIWQKLVYPDDFEKVINYYNQMKNSGVASVLEHRLINKSGEIIWIRNSPIVTKDINNGFLMIEGVVTDITSQKNIEQSNYKNIILAQEKEREYFSQELHDGIGPLVSVAKLYTDLLSKVQGSSCDAIAIMNLQSLLNDISQSVRELSYKLNPSILEKQGVVEALKQFLNRMNQTNAIKVNLNSDSWQPVDDFVKKNVYRIVTELINNTLKYAKASEVNIVLKNCTTFIEIEYDDNGVGFDMETVMKKPDGNGLTNIKNRLSALNGDFKIFSKPNEGVNIRIIINLMNKFSNN